MLLPKSVLSSARTEVIGGTTSDGNVNRPSAAEEAKAEPGTISTKALPACRPLCPRNTTAQRRIAVACRRGRAEKAWEHSRQVRDWTAERSAPHRSSENSWISPPHCESQQPVIGPYPFHTPALSGNNKSAISLTSK